MSYTHVFFDLDGTLFNTEPGIKESIGYALDKMGIKMANPDDINKFIGPPLMNSFLEFCKMTWEDARKAVGYYREYYSVNGIFNAIVYEGVEETLKEMKDRGLVLAVTTSKPEIYAKKIISHFGFDKYFTEVCGATLGTERDSKAAVINYAAQKLNLSERDLKNVLLAGDRKFDIIGAKQCGLVSAGVLYGYGSRGEFEEAGADFIVEKPTDLIGLIPHL